MPIHSNSLVEHIVLQESELLPLPLTFDNLLNPTPEHYAILFSAWKFLPKKSLYGGEEWRFHDNFEKMVNEMVDTQNHADRCNPDGRTIANGDRGKTVRYSALFNARARRIGWSIVLQLINTTGTTCIPPQEYDHEHPSENGIKAHVRRAEEMKERGNEAFKAGDTTAALGTYMIGLSRLCPYISDASIMTFEQASSVGLPQIEYTLMANLLRTFLKASKDRFNLLEFYALHFKTIGCMESGKTFMTYKGRYTLLDLAHRVAKSQSGPPDSKKLADNDWQTLLVSTEAEKESFEWVHEKCCKGDLEAELRA